MLIDFSKPLTPSASIWSCPPFNFHDEYITWIRTLLLDFSSITLVNWYLSRKIHLERGCCHGDSVAGYLFIKAIEVLMLRIFRCLNIYPWKFIKNNAHLQDRYADDFFISIRRQKGSNKRQTNAILKILEEFEDISGVWVNISKTQICPLGTPLATSDYKERKLDKAVMRLQINSHRLYQCLNSKAILSTVNKYLMKFRDWMSSNRDTQYFIDHSLYIAEKEGFLNFYVEYPNSDIWLMVLIVKYYIHKLISISIKPTVLDMPIKIQSILQQI